MPLSAVCGRGRERKGKEDEFSSRCAFVAYVVMYCLPPSPPIHRGVNLPLRLSLSTGIICFFVFILF